MFTKGRIFKNRRSGLTLQAVHIESDRITEINFLLTEAVLIINGKIKTIPKNAKLWDCFQMLAQMA